MEDLKPIIAQNIAVLRQAAGMTQMELAEALHYSDKAVSKWERGESVPDISVLKQVADLFGVTVDRLIASGEPVQPPVRKSRIRPETTRLITAISLLGMAALAVLLMMIFRHWLVFAWTLPAAAVLWLVLNTIWFDRRRNYLIVSCIMWTLLGGLCLTFQTAGMPLWELMALGPIGQIIIWLASRFGKKEERA